MATTRYLCTSCNRVIDFDNRKRNHDCPYCGHWCSYMDKPRLINGTFYKSNHNFYEDTIEIPDGTVDIESGAFEESSIKEIAFPNTLKKISSCCFKGCYNLRKVIIPGSVKEIELSAFSECRSLEEVILEEGVENISEWAFYNCKALKRVFLPNSIKCIGEYAFCGCSKLKNINFPSSLTKIGNKAFCGICNNLTVIFSQNILDVGQDVFDDEWENQKYKYYTNPKSTTEKYLKNKKLEYEYRNCNIGGIFDEGIFEKVLYFNKKKTNVYIVPQSVEIIADGAFENNKELEKVVLSTSVTEIGENAFAGCENLNTVQLYEGLLKIGKGAFKNTGLTYVDLPSTVNAINSEAFDDACVVSISGEMPYYFSRKAKLEQRWRDIEEKNKVILETQEKLTTEQNAFETYLSTKPKKFDYIPDYQAELSTIEKERADRSVSYSKKKSALNELIEQKKTDIKIFSNEKKKTFFLATAKKKELDTQIENKKRELDILLAEQQRLNDEFITVDNSFLGKIQLKQLHLQELQMEQQKWEAECEAQRTRTASIRSNLQIYINEIIPVKTAFDKEKDALEKDYKKWEKAKCKALLLHKTKKLEGEKTEILSKLAFPKYEKLLSYKFTSDEATLFEKILNKAFLKSIDIKNENSKANVYNQYVENHQKEISRIIEINKELNLDENDGIEKFYIREVLNANIEIPKCFKATYDLYSKTDYWKIFSQLAKKFENKNRLKSNLKEFFDIIKLICLSNDNTQLLVLPQCVVRYKENEPLSVFTYNKVSVKLTCKDEEYESENIPPHGEVISKQYKYLNKDGSVSKRYSYNPLVKTVRYTTATIKFGDKTFSFPIDTYQAALQFEEAFNNYCQLFANGEFADLYKSVINTEDVEVINAEIKKYEDAKKKRIEEEKKQKEAEELAAKVAAEEERNRLEAERIAAQIAAEEKRKALIQKQKEINEERKRQAEEQRRILSIFEDETDVQVPVHMEENSLTAPVEVISNRLISNNVFKVEFKQIEDFDADCATCYFISVDGAVISNKKKLTNLEPGTQSTIGFILASGIDFTQMNFCYMCIEANEKVIGKIEFKMNISFYSDF